MLDYRPDLDPTTPEILLDIGDMMPTARGYRQAKYPVAQTAHSLTLGASESIITSLFATRWLSTPGGIVIAGTDKDLYVYDYTNGFIKVSKSGGYSLAGSTYQYGEDSTAAFDHCAFGDVLIATHKSIVPQYRSSLDRTSGTLYANLGTTVAAPKASVCAQASNFVFLGDIRSTWGSSTTVVGSADMVAWCGIGDHQNWDITPTTSQGSYAQFTDTPGPITALAPFSDGIVVFKANAMYLGRYVGPGTNSPVWDFVRISDRIGCVGHRSWTDIGGQLVFVSPEDAYIFDGTRPRSITAGIWETQFRNQISNGGLSPMTIGHDKLNSAVMFFNPVTGRNVVWSYRYDRWSVLLNFANGGDIASSATYSGQVTFCRTNTNDFRVVTTTQTSGTVNTDHSDLYTMFAASSAKSLGVASACKCYNRFNPLASQYSTAAFVTTGWIGDNELLTRFSRVVPRFGETAFGVPTYTSLHMYTRAYAGAAESSDILTPGLQLDTNRRWDLSIAGGGATANWAKFNVRAVADGGNADTGIELIALKVEPKPGGTK